MRFQSLRVFVKRDVLLEWVFPGLAAVVVAGTLAYWQIPGDDGPISVETTVADTTMDSLEILVANLPKDGGAPMSQSSDHVCGHIERHDDTVTAHLTIDDGWHVNANPANPDTLIPTVLSLQSSGEKLHTTIDYPPGRTVDVGLSEPIQVYTGTVEVTATLPSLSPDAPVSATMRVQACGDSGVCLLPSTIHVPQQDDGVSVQTAKKGASSDGNGGAPRSNIKAHSAMC